MTDILLDPFRLDGELPTAGDRLVDDLKVSSARWKVLDAVGMAPAAMPVAHIARNMGPSRQAVQRPVNDLAAQALVRLAPKPHHRRARLQVQNDPKPEDIVHGEKLY